jgi:UDP-GlcNAc:undecaprenyl-phosphate GlcNAc-1-phosphate transferase
MNYIFFAALLSFVLTLVFVPCAKTLAQWLNILDVPDGKIKLHHKAIPYLGGFAVYLSFMITLIILFPYCKQLFLGSVNFYFWLGCFLLVVVGLIDDILVLSPAQKFWGQCFACFLFLYSGCYVYIAYAPYIGFVISGLWILTIINAFNLIDVMDGLSSTIAFFSGLGFMLLALYLGQIGIAYIFASFAGSLIGFLFYNYPPASIYMGDAGSLFLGGILGALPLKLHLAEHSLTSYLTLIIILAIPLLELMSLIIIRSYKKIPFYKGSPDHFSLYLQQHGWSKPLILFYISCMMIACISSVYGFVTGFLSLYQIIILAIIFLIVWFIFIIYGSLFFKRS